MNSVAHILSGRKFKNHLSPKKRQGLMNAVKEQREISMFNTINPHQKMDTWRMDKDPSALVLPEIRQFQDSSASLGFQSHRQMSVQPHRN